ncbi:uncharacterized protein LOC124943152 [Impatiens glandulifera]|uniref:uncharacterized protein LOC124943152 n=1 Tax=Impatiens glandulifera TaxID=253017 RepID=UPI001FB087AE|nr:uncharacterized protein LOC124943152 [Impatiens glandulifera]
MAIHVLCFRDNKEFKGFEEQGIVQTIVGDHDDVIDCVNINNQLASNHHLMDDNNNKDLEYALVRSHDDRYTGGSATFSVWKPNVEDNEFSLTQLWITSGHGANLNSIEVGWMGNTAIDSRKSGLLISRGCYDNDCAGFVQIDFSVELGQPISPISTVGGPISEIKILVYKDSGEDGHWWLDVNGVDIGYFPKNLFTSLSEYAQRVDFGGEIFNRKNEGHHTTTQMGNGLYPHQNGSSFISGIRIYDQDRYSVEGIQQIDSTCPCYGVILINDTIFYGGSGYSASSTYGSPSNSPALYSPISYPPSSNPVVRPPGQVSSGYPGHPPHKNDKRKEVENL